MGDYSSTDFIISFNNSEDLISAFTSSSSKEIGTLVSIPFLPTIAGKLRAIFSIPYSPCIIFETGKIDFSSLRITSHIRLIETAMP